MDDDLRQEIERRQVTDAWRRIDTWLSAHAPASLAVLRPGATEDEIDRLQTTLGVRIPAGLRALWRLHAGVNVDPSASFLLGRWSLMDFASVVHTYEREMMLQRLPGADRFTLWRHAWIPVCSYSADDSSYGLYMDAETGKLGYWDKYGERRIEFESLTTYLEEMADSLEAPSLVTGYRPGLVNDSLVWGPPEHPSERALWVEYTGQTR
ncbi:SMI1/KNR4 family protein [Streptomyces phytophilus]|uniref:SMI1/KNR4 family protein n=1 Tax=Streptomyces phytophilus TaxID=722715 RepID=UPI0015F0374C|nr:SMI1/KNR4 family protein [Streptomyces phytophilus]